MSQPFGLLVYSKTSTRKAEETWLASLQMSNLHSVKLKYGPKEKSERCQTFSLKIVSLYFEFAVEAVFIPLLIKFLDK